LVVEVRTHETKYPHPKLNKPVGTFLIKEPQFGLPLATPQGEREDYLHKAKPAI